MTRAQCGVLLMSYSLLVNSILKKEAPVVIFVKKVKFFYKIFEVRKGYIKSPRTITLKKNYVAIFLYIVIVYIIL